MAKKKVRKRKAKPRARRQAQTVAVIGQSLSVVTPTQMEALDKLRMTPDIVKDMEKKKQEKPSGRGVMQSEHHGL